MNRLYFNMIATCVTLVLLASTAGANVLPGGDPSLLREPSAAAQTSLEELVKKSSPFESVEGFASYYARKFEGRRTTSGHRYNPEKLTAAHQSLPLGTVVKVLNPATGQEVQVTVNDRCAPKSFHFIDLSRAAAKKIGLWGKGKIKVVITPLLEEKLEEPA
ncbi:MAG: septal ring lytic transglycosylase RlpA family protein [Desulfuromonadaceae bacterium]